MRAVVAKGKPTMITLDPKQAEAVEWLSTKRRALLQYPAGGGKTIIAATALDRVSKAKPRSRRVRVGWMANTNEQVGQAYKAMMLVQFGVDVKSSEAAAAWAQHEYASRLIEFRAACSAAETDWSGVDVLVVDEAHHVATAPQWQRQVDTAAGARWAFTATPPEDPALLAGLLDRFGNEHMVVNREAVASRLAAARVVMLPDTNEGLRGLMDAEIDTLIRRRRHCWMGGRIPMLERTIMALRRDNKPDARAIADLEQAEQQLWGQVAWQVCIATGIVTNGARNDAVVRLALEHRNDQTLILVNQIEHGQILSERIPGSSMAFSKMGKKKRAAALEAFAAGRCKCLLATSLADEGLDLPNANVLVLVSGGKSNAKTEQRTGRVLRTFAGKTHGMIYDFLDLQHPLMAKHSRARVDLYRRLGYSLA